MEPELRDWYLSTLGIVQYRPRSSVPVTQDGTLSEAPGSDQRAGRVLVDSDKFESESRGISQSLRDLLAPTKSDGQNKAVAEEQLVPVLEAVPGSEHLSEQPPRVQTPPENALEQEPAIAFRLACWRPSEDLLVIDSWSLGQGKDQSGGPGSSQVGSLGSDNQRFQLLSNILKSIQRKPDTALQPEFIDWPMAGESSLSAARDHLAMFIQGRYEQQAFRWVLAMGDDIRLGLTQTELTEASKLSHLPLSCGAEAIFTPSLSEMLATPACKKDVWAMIRFLY